MKSCMPLKISDLNMHLESDFVTSPLSQLLAKLFQNVLFPLHIICTSSSSFIILLTHMGIISWGSPFLKCVYGQLGIDRKGGGRVYLGNAHCPYM